MQDPGRRCADSSTSTRSSATPSEETRSAIRTSGRCGSTRRPATADGPAIYVLQGFTGQLDMWRNRAAFRPTFLELLDDADIDARIVFVDAWTSVGGSQFVDSAGSGRYHTYLCDEIVPFVDERYGTQRSERSSAASRAAATARP